MLRQTALFLLLIAILFASACASVKRDRCFLPETEYLRMRTIFDTTGSYQRVAQAMEDDQWSHCEVNSFRYRLRKDLGLEAPEYDDLFVQYEPSRQGIDYNPGRVERVP